MSLNDKIPPTMLLLSRALYLPEELTFNERLKTILSVMPNHLSEQTKQKLTEMEGGKVGYKDRLQLILNIEETLKAEREIQEQNQARKEKEKAKLEEEKKIKEEEEEKNKMIEEEKKKMVEEEKQKVVEEAIKMEEEKQKNETENEELNQNEGVQNDRVKTEEVQIDDKKNVTHNEDHLKLIKDEDSHRQKANDVEFQVKK